MPTSYEETIAHLRSHWTYWRRRQDLITAVDSWRSEPGLRDPVTTAVLDVATALSNAHQAAVPNAFMALIADALVRGSHETRKQAVDYFDDFWAAENGSVAVGELCRIAALDTPIAESAANRLWRLRRRGPRIPDASLPPSVLDGALPGARFYYALALAFDAPDARREQLVRIAFAGAIPASFEEPCDGYFPGTMESSRTKAKWPNESDGKPLRHIGGGCSVCGSGATEVLYHHELYYSIGIIEHAEVYCSVCECFTVVRLET